MDGPSARAHTTVPERGNPREAGAGRQRNMVPPFAVTKGVDRQGETGLTRNVAANDTAPFQTRRLEGTDPYIFG